MEYGMNALSILEVTGKKQRIRGAIELALRDWPVAAILPNVIIMSIEQYEMIKKCRNLGDKNSWQGTPPNERIYVSRYNAMEVHIQ